MLKQLSREELWLLAQGQSDCRSCSTQTNWQHWTIGASRGGCPVVRRPFESYCGWVSPRRGLWCRDDEETRAQMGALFGGGDWLGEFQQLVEDDGLSREEAIIELYKRRLKRAGDFEFVRSIRVLKPDSDRPYFHLVYATRHAKGVNRACQGRERVLRAAGGGARHADPRLNDGW